jgi:hypothetical protein
MASGGSTGRRPKERIPPSAAIGPNPLSCQTIFAAAAPTCKAQRDDFFGAAAYGPVPSTRPGVRTRIVVIEEFDP